MTTGQTPESDAERHGLTAPARAGALVGYSFPERHATASRIIRARSSNPVDVRERVLAGIDLSDCLRVLDLGCGYGFMAEALAPKLPPEALLTGVDAFSANRRPFLERAGADGRRAAFHCLDLARGLPWPEGSFDLVVSSYSLYFFPQLVPEVARVLDPLGRFIALTHRESAVEDLLRVAGLPGEGAPLLELVRGFSGENGARLLRIHFGRVEVREYPNSLSFGQEDQEELLTYLRFKIRLLVECSDEGERLCSWFEQGLEERVRSVLRRGPVAIRKDDTAYWATRPKRPAGQIDR